MGEYKTQSRTIGSLPRMLRHTGDGTPWSLQGEFQPSYAPSQLTESYRTEYESPDAISASEIRDFTTVTRNGFTTSNPKYDTGHEFYTTKTYIRFSHPDWKMYKTNTSGVKVYKKGPLVPLKNDSNQGVGDFPVAPRLTDSEVKSYGSKAIASTIPTNSIANLAVFIGEMLEALPSVIGASLLQSRADKFRSLGGEYLNVQFGWAPFISDLQKTLKAVQSSHKTIRQYARDSGRVVRRRWHFPTETSSTLSGNIKRSGTTGLWLYAENPTWIAGSTGYEVLQETVKARDLWFSGAFMYYLNPGDSFLDRMDRYAAQADHLLGISLTPEVLWELQPWSWLVDWVSDIGDVMTNASALSSNGLVMKYGYLMCHTREFNKYVIPTGVTFVGNLKSGPIYSIFGRETKERRKATPYGFTMDPGSFSAFQWSILGALGLTKAPRILH